MTSIRLLKILSTVICSASLSLYAQTGTIKSHQKISDTEGIFTGVLDDTDLFGYSTATLGDVDGDGVNDLAVGASYDDDGGATGSSNRGAVWILFLNANGTVKAHQKINANQGNFTGAMNISDWLGNGVANLGDMDGDQVPEIEVGALRALR